MNRKFGFTLAEILITLGVIGVVSAITMPTLIQNHKKRIVVTRLQKFYTSMNQALKLSEVQNGEIKYWDKVPNDLNANDMYDWYKKYFGNYFVSKEVEKVADGILVKNTDGSSFGMYSGQGIHVVYCVDYKACQNYLKANNNKIIHYVFDGKNTFFFQFKNQFVPYGMGYTREILRGEDKSPLVFSCSEKYRKHFCGALIMQDGWKIADDYPVRF